MTIAFVMSGGGSRGDFQLGALTALTEAGKLPDIVCSASVGSLNALMLTQGNDGVSRLRDIWFGLRRNDHMWLFEQWWDDLQPDLRATLFASLTGGATSSTEFWPVSTSTIAGAGFGVPFGPFGLLTGALLGAAISGTIQNITAQALKDMLLILQNKARALLNLTPIRTLMNQQFDNGLFDAFVASGRKLRFATVGLESGELHYVTERGTLLKRDGLTEIANGISILDGAFASSAIAAIFPPVNFAGDAWVDGGHRESVPLRAAIEAGATEIYVLLTGPVDRSSSVNRSEDAPFVPPVTDFENRHILDIAKRALLDIHLDEMEADDVFPVLDAHPQLKIKIIAPQFPTHDIVTIDPELVRINYDYGYRAAWDAINDAPQAMVDSSTTIAVNLGRAARLRKQSWNNTNVPMAAEISDRNAAAAQAMADRTAANARIAGPYPDKPLSQSDYLVPGERMMPGQSIASADGAFMLVYQTDGNLVIYHSTPGDRFTNPIWATGTNGTAPGVCVMRRDGNLVIYDPAMQTVWASGTDGHPDVFLWLKSNGQLVLHRNGNVIWQVGTPQQAMQSITIVNASPIAVSVTIYKSDDTTYVATLPDGRRTIEAGARLDWTVPADVAAVKVFFNDRNETIISAGGSYTYTIDDRLHIDNQTGQSLAVKIFKDTDIVFIATLPGGDFTIGAMAEGTWSFPGDVDKVAVIMNNRVHDHGVRGSRLTYTLDIRIQIQNLSDGAARAKFFKLDDTVLLFTLPGGDITVAAHSSGFYTVPSDINDVQVRLNGIRVNAKPGDLLNVNPDGSITKGIIPQ